MRFVNHPRLCRRETTLFSIPICLIHILVLMDRFLSYIRQCMLVRKIMLWKDPEMTPLSLQNDKDSSYYYGNNNW